MTVLKASETEDEPFTVVMNAIYGLTMPSQYKQQASHLLLLLEEDPKSRETKNICCTSKSVLEPRQSSIPRQQGLVGGPPAMHPEFWTYIFQFWKWRGHVPPKIWHSPKKTYCITAHKTTILTITTENTTIYWAIFIFVFPAHRTKNCTWSVI
jgi:hypothetical protein